MPKPTFTIAKTRSTTMIFTTEAVVLGNQSVRDRRLIGRALIISRGTKVAYRAKTHIFAPERYTAGILYTDSLNSA